MTKNNVTGDGHGICTAPIPTSWDRHYEFPGGVLSQTVLVGEDSGLVQSQVNCREVKPIELCRIHNKCGLESANSGWHLCIWGLSI